MDHPSLRLIVIMPEAYLLNLELMSYPQAWELQRRIVERKVKGPFPDVLILIEHPPVITLGRRGREDNIRVAKQDIVRHAVCVHRVERGGDVTYHGPGQLVGYPVLALQPLGVGVVEFVSRLEDIMIGILADCGVKGRRDPPRRGVWVGRDKIGSVGVAVRRWITYHGFALNYDPIEAHMDYVTPCGLTGVCMTSIKRQTGASPDPAWLRARAAHHFCRMFGMKLKAVSLKEMEKELLDGSQG